MRPLLILIFLIINIDVDAQADTWRSEDGLSNDWVSDIVQDNSGFLWVATQYGLNKFDGYEFETINYNPESTNSLSGNWVRNLAVDQDGQIYLNCYLGNTHILDPISGQLVQLQVSKGNPGPKIVRKLFVDASNDLWIGSEEGLYKVEHGTTNIIFVHDLQVRDIAQERGGPLLILTRDAVYRMNSSLLKQVHTFTDEYDIQQLFIDRSGATWAVLTNGLFQVDSEKWKLNRYRIDDFNSLKIFNRTSIYEDRQERIWLAGENGINIISADRRDIEYIPLEALRTEDPNTIEIVKFFEDRIGNIWIGTNKGLTMTSSLHTRFKAPDSLGLLQNVTGVRSIHMDEQHIWLGTQDALFEFNKNDLEANPKNILSQTIHSFHKASDGVTYVGSNRNIYIRKKDQKEFSVMRSKNIAGGVTFDIAEDKEGFIWFASLNGLNRYDPQKNTFIKFNSANNQTLQSSISIVLVIDQNGNLWGGSLTSGVYQLMNTYNISTPESAIFKNYSNIKGDRNSLSSNIVQSMTMSLDGSIWVGTDGGLNRINKGGRIQQYLKSDGLLDDKFMSLHVDENSILWGSTIGHGIMAMNLNNDEVQYFDKSDGLKSNNYLFNSGFLDKDGLLYLGTDSETQIVDTKNVLQTDPIQTNFKFSSINFLSNKSQEKSSLPIYNEQIIKVPFNESSFNISFTTVQYFKPHKTDYSYRILPIQDGWQSNGSSRKINFNGLNEGLYNLEVKASNPLLELDPAIIRLNIRVLPPWWRSMWAYLLYAIAVAGLILLILKRQKEKAEAHKLRELNDLKTKLYTNITHEIRTPLTVILGLSKKLMNDSKKTIVSTSEIINRNGNHLLLLVNRILDLSKIESGKMPVNFVQQDIINYMAYLLESFHSWAEDKDIRVHFLAKEDNLLMDFDREIIKQIINNLMSNAIKYSPLGGDIYCEIERIKSTLFIHIRDSGDGIDEENISLLFERFYQQEATQNSSGIGLAITKELVQLCNGEISVRNNAKKGCTFSISLPISNQALVSSNDVHPNPIDELSFISGDIDQILIIEDNQDVREFMFDCLRGQYNVIQASNGQEGIDMCIKHIPDLVISDVMMPGLSGFEVCQKIKLDQRTDHIPIILLTAKADQESKMTGLEKGADDYLIKPFDPTELEIRISNLLTIRKTLRAKYQSNLLDKVVHKGQDLFIEKVIKLIDENLSDSNFGIHQICRKLGISRVHLHRKLKALTEQSTAIFIRNIRLNRAHHMLLTSEKNVSEIAYDTGFSDPAYFSKLYSEKYGGPPSKAKK